MRCGQMHTVLRRIKTEKKGKIDFHIFFTFGLVLLNCLYFTGKEMINIIIYLSHFDRSAGAPRLPPVPSDFKGKK